MLNEIFRDTARIDARAKVLGQALYGADHRPEGMLHAMLVPARIAKGMVQVLDPNRALSVPGVVLVLSAGDFPTLPTEISYLGQPIALVVAETLEAAFEGGEAIEAAYQMAPFAAVMTSPDARVEPSDGFAHGDAAAAFAGAAAIVEGTFETPTQFHNAIELFGTVAVWSGGQLTIHEGCQNSDNARNALAEQLGIAVEQIVIKSEHVGGGFGQKSPPKLQTGLVAHAARLTGRPVKLVTPRGQMCHIANYRPCSVHRIRLAANGEGRLSGIIYDVAHEKSASGTFGAAGYFEPIARHYEIPNFQATTADVIIDRQAPRQTRGTHPFPAGFALESAIDEMAYLLGRDPVELRLEHEAKTDIIAGQPLSPHFLNECLTEGARRFEWTRRLPQPQSMRLADGTMVGLGVACGIFGAPGSAAETTLRVRADGTTRIVSSGHEMGQGLRTAVANVLIQGLGVNPAGIEVLLGDTSLGPQMATVGDRGTSSIIPATAKAVAALLARYNDLAGANSPAGNLHERLARLKRPFIEVTVSELAPGQDNTALEAFRSRGRAGAGAEYPGFTSMAWIAQFVEIHINPRTGHIRMPRAVSIADIGRVISPVTARSQMYGGVIWGYSTAMLESADVDPRYAGYLNPDFADYHMAVHADIGEIDVGFIDKPDPQVNSMGVKGMGELVMLGTAPAIANAIYHATGKRVRRLPIRIEDVL